jgi:hypothetical protein
MQPQTLNVQFFSSKVGGNKSIISALAHVFSMCTFDNWFIVIKKMKNTCSIVAIDFIEKLDQRFYSPKFMNAIRIIYPLYWLNFNANSTFLADLAFLKTQYCLEREFGDEGLKLLALLNEWKLDMGVNIFKVTMQITCK